MFSVSSFHIQERKRCTEWLPSHLQGFGAEQFPSEVTLTYDFLNTQQKYLHTTSNLVYSEESGFVDCKDIFYGSRVLLFVCLFVEQRV